MTEIYVQPRAWDVIYFRSYTEDRTLLILIIGSETIAFVFAESIFVFRY